MSHKQHSVRTQTCTVLQTTHTVSADDMKRQQWIQLQAD